MKPSRSFAHPIVAATLAAFSLVASAPSAARACGGEWYPMFEVDPRVQGVDKAEDSLDDGHILAAAGSIVRMIPHIRQLSVTRTKLIQRADRVLAVATARFDGALPIGLEVPEYAQGKWLGKTEADRQANLEWAAKTLREVATARHDDPAARTELAEALARIDGTREEARHILEDLSTRDLITSPEGYAALAGLRERAGDDAGRRAALERCKTMARGGVTCDPHAVSAAT
jgi:hypothetical protein